MTCRQCHICDWLFELTNANQKYCRECRPKEFAKKYAAAHRNRTARRIVQNRYYAKYRDRERVRNVAKVKRFKQLNPQRWQEIKSKNKRGFNSFTRFMWTAFTLNRMNASFKKGIDMDSPRTLDDYRSELEGISVEELKNQFASMYSDLIDNIGRLAVRLVAIEAAGDSVRINCDPRDFPMHKRFFNVLRDIGNDRVILKAVPLMWSRPADFILIRALPIEDQEELMALSEWEREKRLGSHSGKAGGRGAGSRAIRAVSQLNLAQMASEYNVRDVADMALSLIRMSQHPSVVAEMVREGLAEFFTVPEPSTNGTHKTPKKKSVVA